MSNVDGKGLPRYGEFPKNERPGHAELDAEMDDAIARDDHKDRISTVPVKLRLFPIDNALLMDIPVPAENQPGQRCGPEATGPGAAVDAAQ